MFEGGTAKDWADSCNEAECESEDRRLRIEELEQENKRLQDEVERADAALSIDNTRSAG